MSRPSTPRRAGVRALFDRLADLRDSLLGAARPQRGTPPRTLLVAEALEERVVLDGRPLPFPTIFVGAGPGHAPTVRAYDADTGTLNWEADAFSPSFLGGVRVGTADLTGDGFPDVVVAPGPGHAPTVRVLDGKTGERIGGPLGEFTAFAKGFKGGVHVAAADVDGDGTPDVVAAAVLPSGARVRAFSGATGEVIADFKVAGSPFAAGVTVAAADLTGDRRAEVVVGAGGSSRVRTYDPLTGTEVSGPLGSFRAFGKDFTPGVFVGSDSLAADVDADGTPDLAVGTASGEGRVRVFSGKTGGLLHDLYPFGEGSTGGARVALAYADDDEFADVVVGSGPGSPAAVRVFSGATGAQLDAPRGEYAPFGSFAGGVSVAASNDPMLPGLSLTAPSTAVVGQVFLASVRVGSMFSTPPAPTGTVTLTANDGTNTYNLGTVTLVADGTGYAADAAYTLGDLPAGTYSFTATYSGDANYVSSWFTTLPWLTVSAPASGVPADAAPVGGGGPDLVSGPAGAGGATRGGLSESGVAYGSGAATLASTDLASGGYGSGWGLGWSWTSLDGYADGTSGGGATTSQSAHLVQANGDDSLALVSNAGTVHFFDLYGGAYHERYGGTGSLSHDATNHLFVLADGTGRTLTFYDFSGSTPSGRAGKLISLEDAAGGLTEVTSWDGSGRPTEVQRATGTGGSALTESFLTTYVASGAGAGQVDTVTQRTRVGTGSWSTVRSADYDYYDGTTGPGLAGALKTAVVKDPSGNTIDTRYYRYYTSGTGTSGKVKYAFGADAYGRLTAALGTGVDSLTDGQVDDYADRYMEYDSSGRATKAVNAGAGDSTGSGGQGEYTYAYTTNSSSTLLDANTWRTKTVETRPDGSTWTVYTNAAGQVMLEDFDDAGASGNWLRFYRYDESGRTVLEASPAAVTGYSDSYADLVNYTSGNASYLDDDDGLVTIYSYPTATTATTSTAGDALGFLKAVSIRHGETGTDVPQAALDYIARSAGGETFYHVASQTVYRNDNGTGGQTTGYSYTFTSGTSHVEAVAITLPTVTTAQNGSNSATSLASVFDEFGHLVWSKDQGGYISYFEYDDVTGAVTKAIADVDTTQTGTFSGLPSGWSTTAGGGRHLTTTYEVDALGRVTKETTPAGRVNYTVYDDDAHEVRYYPGWDSTNNVPSGPTTVMREDRANGYTETLTMSATPSVSSGRPTGGESISAVQSLSRSYVNAAGQVTHSDAYFDLSGLTYSTAANIGTEGVNFYRTEFRYDDHGQMNRVETPLGTITRTVRDGQGRAVSEWVGTDDTPTTGFWSPTNTTGTDLVKVREYEYDGGGVGDGNLTSVSEIPGGGAADRVTETYYDWRDRAVAVKAGVEGSESTSVNRPLTYYDYDNLGRVTKTRVYDADAQTPSYTNDVPQPLSSSLLRAQSANSFDELGRVYRSDTYSVDPSSGSVASDTLYSLNWYDPRGNLIKTLSPGGLVQKSVYDGAGMVTAAYLTDGGGDSGYSDADDVTGDTVLEQSETTWDADGLPLSVLSRLRFHDASGTGALGSPSSGIGARVSYAGYYYDAGGRTTAVVDVGTNGGSSWTRPGSVPSRSDTVLVNSYSYVADAVQTVRLTGSPTGGTFTLTFGGQTTSAIAYNASAATVDSVLEALASVGSGNVAVIAAPGGGWEVRFAGSLAGKYQARMTGSGASLTGGTSPAVAVSTISAGGDAGGVAETTDPRGLVSRTYSDSLGRARRTIENFADGAVSDADDKTTDYAYNAAGMTSLTAQLAGGSGQTTAWVYGVTTGGGSAITSNDVSAVTQWPDPSTGAAGGSEQETTTVNALGQAVTYTDRNGSVHTLTYDVLGRVVSDAVTTLGSGVDGSVRRIETAYDGQGNAYLVTSYDAASSGSVVNQVQRAFNGLGQMTTEWQAHGGAVNTSTSPKVQYAYSEMPSGANHSRLTSVTYPSGYVLTYNYSSGLNSSVSRLSSLSDSGGTLESYDYLGFGTVIRRAHSQPGVDLTYIGTPADGGDQYAGLDRFGRVVDQLWKLSASPGTALSRFQYGYDRGGNRLWRDDLVNTAMGELYGYDGLNQLTAFDRGTLNGTRTGLTGAASRTQDWDFDAVGNWDSLTTNGGSPQTRTHNAQNEVTAVGGATSPTFDANGNMTQAETGLRYVYDAWNRLVTIKDSPGTTTLKTYAYDGLGRRVSETASGTTTDLFYSAGWQVLEEKVGANTTKRYVWSSVYIDALVLRDRDTNADGTLDERLWVIQDANWNVVALYDGSGSVVERYAYDPFGVAAVYDASYTVRGGGSNYAWGYLHQGGRSDSVSGLYHFRSRDYSATLGRWASIDPKRFDAGDVNLYRGVGNGPVNRVDPSGLDWVWPWDVQADWSDWRLGEAGRDAWRTANDHSYVVGNRLTFGLVPGWDRHANWLLKTGRVSNSTVWVTDVVSTVLVARAGFNLIRASMGPTGPVLVTSWVPRGLQADFSPGRWVMVGGPTAWNYFRTGLWGPQGEFKKMFPYVRLWWGGDYVAHTTLVASSQVRWPSGLDWFTKGLFFGQRVIGP